MEGELVAIFLYQKLKNVTGRCQQTLCPKMFVDNNEQCFAFTTPQAHNLKVMRSNPGYILKSFLLYTFVFLPLMMIF